MSYIHVQTRSRSDQNVAVLNSLNSSLSADVLLRFDMDICNGAICWLLVCKLLFFFLEVLVVLEGFPMAAPCKAVFTKQLIAQVVFGNHVL